MSLQPICRWLLILFVFVGLLLVRLLAGALLVCLFLISFLLISCLLGGLFLLLGGLAQLLLFVSMLLALGLPGLLLCLNDGVAINPVERLVHVDPAEAVLLGPERGPHRRNLVG